MKANILASCIKSTCQQTKARFLRTPDADDFLPTVNTNCRNLFAFRIIEVDDCGPFWRQNSCEQTHFRIKISFERLMIIKMILCEVRKTCSRQQNSIKPLFGLNRGSTPPSRRGLHRLSLLRPKRGAALSAQVLCGAMDATKHLQRPSSQGLHRQAQALPISVSQTLKTEVFPFVPVTAITVSGCAPDHIEAV